MTTPTQPEVEPSGDDAAQIAALAHAYRRLRDEIGKVIIGQENVVEDLLTGLFARGHVLLIGVPGLAKTLLVSTLARILQLSFRRIQFTPDMMPSDITGHRHPPGRPRDRPEAVHVHRRADLHQYDPGR